jgi:hypothetical protein
MAYLKTREVAAIAIGAALWGVLNSIFSPVVFSLTGLPILCDLIGFTVLTIAAWWIRKLGALSAIGLIATAINFAINPQAVIFLGFTAASAVFDASSRLAGYENTFKKPKITMVVAILASTLSAAVAGIIIGSFFMAGPAVAIWGGVAGWAALHATGGLIGGSMGGFVVNMLVSRKALNSTPNQNRL